MRKKNIVWNFRVHACFAILMMIFIWFLNNFFNMKKQAASIGIIGGADGPTAIFITGKTTNQLLLILLENLSGIFIFIILLLLYKPIKSLLEKRN